MHLVGNKDAVGRKPLVAPHKASERHLLEKALQRLEAPVMRATFPTHVFPYLLSSLKTLGGSVMGLFQHYRCGRQSSS